MEKLEIRAVVKYFCKKGMHPKEILEDFMEILGKESPFDSTVKKWAAEFKRGRERVEDDGRYGRPNDATTDENVKVMHTLIMCDRRRDLRSITSQVGISFRAIQSILSYILGISKVSARWVLRMLTDDQERTRLNISRYLLSRYEDDPGDFIERVVTLDEPWVYHFDPGSKMQSKQWKHPGSTLQRN